MMKKKKRLIYADDLLSLYNMSAIYEAGEYGLGCIDIINDIKNAPIVDAVEVVRCKDCKYKGWIQEVCHGKSVDYCHIWDSCINDSGKDFCSYGERKLND